MKKIFATALIILITITPCTAKQTAKDNEHSKKTAEYLNLKWWKNYKDDILIEHLTNLYKYNYDLKNAELKIKENEKSVKIQFAGELPQISFDGDIMRDFRSSELRFGSMSVPSYSQSNFNLPLTASYEIDIWGRNRLKTKSLEQKLEIAEQSERATYISLTSDFASDYFNLIKTDKLLEIQDEIIKTQNEILSKIQEKYKTGLCSINEVLKEKKLLTVLSEEKNNLEDKKEVLENVLRAYLCVTAGGIARTDFDNIQINELLDNIPGQFDTNVIETRPDFLQSEAGIKIAGYNVRIARKELLPRFIIYGQLGLNAYNFSDLFKTSTQLANAGILPAFDIFSGGRKLAFLKLKKYQYDEALNNYKKTIAEDIKEVNTALSGLKTSKKDYNEALERLNTQNKIYNLSKDREIIGSASKLDVLYEKEIDLIAEKDKISNEINYIISTISLYKSTGGKDLYEPGKDEDKNEDI